MVRLAAILCAILAIAPARADGLTVFAAASLTDVLQQAALAYEEDHGTPLTLSFAASSTLARQIERGAPADLFISANRAWIDHLKAAGAVNPASVRTLARNRLIIAGSVFETGPLNLRQILNGQVQDRIAVGDPAHVPAGLYAQQALHNLGFWNAVQRRLLPAANTRAALRFVRHRAARFVIAYRTDARAFPDLRELAAFPAHAHDPILYHAAATRQAKERANHLLDWLTEDKAAAILATHGFQPCRGRC